MTDAEEAEVVAWLEGGAERKIETGCAWVFLAGETAFKVKKRVDLGFLDYSTLDLRFWALERGPTGCANWASGRKRALPSSATSA